MKIRIRVETEFGWGETRSHDLGTVERDSIGASDEDFGLSLAEGKGSVANFRLGSGQNLGVRLRSCGMRWSTFHRERQPARWQRDGRLWVTISCVGVFPCVCCRCRPRSLLHGTKRSEDHCGIANRSRSGCPYCLPDRCRVPGNALGREQPRHALQDHLYEAARNQSSAIEGPWWRLEPFHATDTIATFLQVARTTPGCPGNSWFAAAPLWRSRHVLPASRCATNRGYGEPARRRRSARDWAMRVLHPKSR